MNRVQFEEAIIKCEKTIKKNFAKHELNDLWLFIGRERKLHTDDNADELATKIYKYLKAIGNLYGVKVGFADEEVDE